MNKSNLNIVNIISKYMKLKKSGEYNYFGICPFHKENTPSFSINIKKNFFYCFGCGIYGNKNDFVSKYLSKNINKNINLNKKKYLKINSKKLFSTKFLKIKNKKNPLNCYKKMLLLNIIFFLKNYYKTLLFKNIFILNYFKKRNISTKIIIKFNLGYSSFLSSKKIIFYCLNYSKDIFDEIGIFFFKKNKIYNIFINRIIFPIKNSIGEIVAFAGRILSDKKPKYINSFNTLIFEKKKLLYGFWENKLYIKKIGYAIIVEGYMDVISLFQHGIKNSVALMGNNVNKWHLETIFNLTEKVIFCFDSDNSGIIASKNSLNLILRSNFFYKNISYCILPKNLDPDKFINLFGIFKFNTKLIKSFSIKNFIYIFYIKILYLKNSLNLSIFYEFKKLLKNIFDIEIKKEILKLIPKNKNISINNFVDLLDDLIIDKKIFFPIKKKFFYFWELKILNLFLIYPDIILFINKNFLKKIVKVFKNKLLFIDILNNFNLSIKTNSNFIDLFLNIKYNSKYYYIYKYLILKSKNKKLYKIIKNGFYKKKRLNIIFNFLKVYYKKILK